MEYNEFDLVKRAKNNDIGAFAALVRIHETRIRSCLAVRMDTPDEANDLTQETFIIAYKKLSEFDSEKPLGPWLRGIALNLLKNHWRKYKAIPVGSVRELEVLLEEEISEKYSTENELAMLHALRDCLTKLDQSSAKLIDQHYNQGFSIGKLKEYYGVKHSTMTMRLHRLRESLKNCIKSEIDDSSKSGLNMMSSHLGRVK